MRLEQRLGFTIESRTAELISDALPMLDRVSGERIRHEFELALREPDPAPIVERLAQLNVLQELHTGLDWQPQTATHFARLQQLMASDLWHGALQGESPASVYFAIWLAPLSPQARRVTMERVRVRKSTREEVQGVARLLESLAPLEPDPAPSLVEKLLRHFAVRPRILLAARAVAGDTAAVLLDRYQSEWRHVRPELDGNDLREMGLKPGPAYGVLLDRLLAARLDGLVSGETEERAFLQAVIDEMDLAVS